MKKSRLEMYLKPPVRNSLTEYILRGWWATVGPLKTQEAVSHRARTPLKSDLSSQEDFVCQGSAESKERVDLLDNASSLGSTTLVSLQTRSGGHPRTNKR